MPRLPRPAILTLLVLTGCSAPPVPQYRGDLRAKSGFFVVYGDTQDALWWEVHREDTDRPRKLVAREVVAEDPDFVLNTGDLVGKGSCAGQWRQFDREQRALRARGIPYLPALGNHEYWGCKQEAMAHYFARFPALRGRKWYDARYQGLLVLVLDSNDTELTPVEIEAQSRWLKERLKAASADASVRAVILATHHPPYTNAEWIPASEFVRERFLKPARACPKVKMVLSGHVHSYERFTRDGIQFVVSGGAGAPRRWNEVAGPKGTYRDRYDGPRRFNYLRVRPDARGVSIEVRMLDEQETWATADRFRVTY